MNNYIFIVISIFILIIFIAFYFKDWVEKNSKVITISLTLLSFIFILFGYFLNRYDDSTTAGKIIETSLEKDIKYIDDPLNTTIIASYNNENKTYNILSKNSFNELIDIYESQKEETNSVSISSLNTDSAMEIIKFKSFLNEQISQLNYYNSNVQKKLTNNDNLVNKDIIDLYNHYMLKTKQAIYKENYSTLKLKTKDKYDDITSKKSSMEIETDKIISESFGID